MRSSTKLIKSVYTNLEAELHDLFWNQDDIISELPLLEEFYAKKLALEVGCGSGRLLLPLIAEGYPIDGVEISSDMTSLLAKSAAEVNLQPEIHTVDIVEFQTSKQYERVSIPAFTCQLLSRADFSTTLENIHSYTSADGQLYFTVFIPWAEITGELPDGDWYDDHQATLSDDSTALCKTKFTINRLRQTLTRRHRYSISGGSNKEHRSTQELQWYTYPELNIILASTGWKVKQLITDLESGTTPDSDAHILTIIATKI